MVQSEQRFFIQPQLYIQRVYGERNEAAECIVLKDGAAMEWTKENMIKALSEKAAESRKKAVGEIDTIGQTPGKHPATHILNAEYGLAQYHAYLELLFELDAIDEYVKCSEDGKENAHRILQMVDQQFYKGVKNG